MIFSQKTLTITIIVVTASMVGLIIAQFVILKTTIEANKLLHQQKKELVLQDVSQTFEDNRYAIEGLEAIIENGALDSVRFQRFNKELSHLIDSIFQMYNLTIEYQYAIYEHKDDDSFEPIWTNIKDAAFNFDSCEDVAQTNLTCDGILSSDYHLVIHFPNDRREIIYKSLNSVAILFALILTVIGAFSYAVLFIRKQKKLAELKNDFINTLTHEFKTPIFSIAVALKTIKRSDFNPEKLTKYISVIESENNRLKNQVDKILQLALIESGNFLLEKEETNVHEELEKVIENFRLILEERSTRMTTFFQAEKPVVQADKIHLNNAFYNLLDNAMKFTEGRPEISISTNSNAAGLNISFRDNGVGIDDSEKKLIFEKFFRNIDRSKNRNGFGLGLYYTYNIIKAHKGNLIIDSKVGEGSEFTITIPYEK